MSVHEFHEMCLLLEQEFGLSQHVEGYRMMVSGGIEYRRARAKDSCSDIVDDDSSDYASSDEDTESTVGDDYY